MLQRQHNDTQSNQLLLTTRWCPTRYLSDVAPDVMSWGFRSSVVIELVKRIWLKFGKYANQRRSRSVHSTKCALSAIYKVCFIIICLGIFRWMEGQSHRCRRKWCEARRWCFKANSTHLYFCKAVFIGKLIKVYKPLSSVLTDFVIGGSQVGLPRR